MPGVDYTCEETCRPTRLPVEQATTLIPDAYRDPAFASVERDRVCRRSWVCVGYTSQISAPGDIMTTDVAGEPVMIVRDGNGQLQAFYNVCRHRGCALVDAEHTHCQVIRCPYHSWGYALDGRLIGAPYFHGLDVPDDVCKTFDTAAAEQAGFRREDFSLLPVNVATWGCFIFVNLDRNARPLTEWLGDLPTRYLRHPLADLKLYKRLRYDIAANWKLVAENFIEYYHLPWVHPELCKISAVDNHHRYQGPGMYTGMCTSPLSVDPDTVRFDMPIPPDLNDVEAHSAYFVLLFPNLALWIFPNHVVTLLYRPSGATTTQECMDMLLHPEALAHADLDAQCRPVLDFYGMVNKQDIAIVERVQRGLKASAYPGGRMCFRFEEPVHRFQNMLIDRMVGLDRIPPGDG